MAGYLNIQGTKVSEDVLDLGRHLAFCFDLPFLIDDTHMDAAKRYVEGGVVVHCYSPSWILFGIPKGDVDATRLAPIHLRCSPSVPSVSWIWYPVSSQEYSELREKSGISTLFQFVDIAKSLEPVATQNVDNVIAIAAGSKHSMALDTSGAVWAWGDNFYGQLGDVSRVDRSNPVQVRRLNDVSSVVAGDDYSLALREDGTVWAWGANSGSRLGIATTHLCYVDGCN